MVLVAVMFVVVVATLALAARAHRRRQLDDARAEARHWVERLGGELLVLDGAAARLGTGSCCGTGRSCRAIHRCRCRARGRADPETVPHRAGHGRRRPAPRADRAQVTRPRSRPEGSRSGRWRRPARSPSGRCRVHPEAGRRCPRRGPRACPPVARRHDGACRVDPPGTAALDAPGVAFVADRNTKPPGSSGCFTRGPRGTDGGRSAPRRLRGGQVVRQANFSRPGCEGPGRARYVSQATPSPSRSSFRE